MHPPQISEQGGDSRSLLTEENRERVRAYVAQLIAAQGVPEAEKIVSDI